MHLHTHINMGEAAAPKGWTGPDMEAAQQLVHLSSDEEAECSNRGSREAKAAAGGQSRGEEGEATSRVKGKRAAGKELDGGVEDDEDGKGSCSRKRRFRSIAYIYKVTRPVRLHDEAKRRKISH